MLSLFYGFGCSSPQESFKKQKYFSIDSLITAQISALESRQKALTKTSLTDAQALAQYRMAEETIDKLNKTLNDLANPLSETEKIRALERKAYFENVVDILGARVKGILGADIIDVTPKAGTS